LYLWVPIAIGSAGAFFLLFLGFGDWFTSRLVARVLKCRLNSNVIEASEVVETLCTRIMILDAALLTAIMIPTGGLHQSIYAPLACAIFTSAIALRMSRRSTGVVVTSVIFIYAFGELVYFFLVYIHVLRHPSEPESFVWALMINLAMATLLTLLGDIPLYRRSLPTIERHRALRDMSPFIHDTHAVSVANDEAMWLFACTIQRRAENCTLSVVHDVVTILHHAIILNLPYSSGNSNPIALEAIAYTTFVAHWIDDYVDHLYVGLDKLKWSGDVVKEIESSSRHFKRVVRRVRRRFGAKKDMLERIAYYSEKSLINKDRRREDVLRIIDLGINRICLTGVMQQCNSEAEIAKMLEKYVSLVCSVEGFNKQLAEEYRELLQDQTNWVIIWATGKVVCEMFDCHVSSFNINCSELYTLLAVPFLLFEDLTMERTMERYSEAFRHKISDFRTTVADEKIFGKCVDIFERNSALVMGESDQTHVL
jgi:hypothetical protein